jgi:hypothetical protein
VGGLEPVPTPAKECVQRAHKVLRAHKVKRTAISATISVKKKKIFRKIIFTEDKRGNSAAHS